MSSNGIIRFFELDWKQTLRHNSNIPLVKFFRAGNSLFYHTSGAFLYFLGLLMGF
ncbi:hypothetical protein KAR34_00050 [bacterium]|nr:hypothetical protein [bacterium]